MYELVQLFESLVDLRKQLIMDDVPHNPDILELTNKRIKEVLSIESIVESLN